MSDFRPIHVPLNFQGAQLNLYTMPNATAEAVEAGRFVGSTRRGGAVNFDTLHLTPHCNGTHTECVGHVVDANICIEEILPPADWLATLLSITPVRLETSGEMYGMASAPEDLVITAAALTEALEASDSYSAHLQGLVVRTLPNAPDKQIAQYPGTDPQPPYFTHEAMQLIVSWGVRHLVTDLPSLDRLADGGRVMNHRIFWNLPEEGHWLGQAARREATITELVYAPNDLTDGRYLLRLEIPPFLSDAAPSRVFLRADR